MKIAHLLFVAAGVLACSVEGVKVLTAAEPTAKRRPLKLKHRAHKDRAHHATKRGPRRKMDAYIDRRALSHSVSPPPLPTTADESDEDNYFFKPAFTDSDSDTNFDDWDSDLNVVDDHEEYHGKGAGGAWTAEDEELLEQQLYGPRSSRSASPLTLLPPPKAPLRAPPKAPPAPVHVPPMPPMPPMPPALGAQPKLAMTVTYWMRKLFSVADEESSATATATASHHNRNRKLLPGHGPAHVFPAEPIDDEGDGDEDEDGSSDSGASNSFSSSDGTESSYTASASASASNSTDITTGSDTRDTPSEGWWAASSKPMLYSALGVVSILLIAAGLMAYKHLVYSGYSRPSGKDDEEAEGREGTEGNDNEDRMDVLAIAGPIVDPADPSSGADLESGLPNSERSGNDNGTGGSSSLKYYAPAPTTKQELNPSPAATVENGNGNAINVPSPADSAPSTATAAPGITVGMLSSLKSSISYHLFGNIPRVDLRLGADGSAAEMLSDKHGSYEPVLLGDSSRGPEQQEPAPEEAGGATCYASVSEDKDEDSDKKKSKEEKLIAAEKALDSSASSLFTKWLGVIPLSGPTPSEDPTATALTPLAGAEEEEDVGYDTPCTDAYMSAGSSANAAAALKSSFSSPKRVKVHSSIEAMVAGMALRASSPTSAGDNNSSDNNSSDNNRSEGVNRELNTTASGFTDNRFSTLSVGSSSTTDTIDATGNDHGADADDSASGYSDKKVFPPVKSLDEATTTANAKAALLAQAQFPGDALPLVHSSSMDASVRMYTSVDGLGVMQQEAEIESCEG